MSAVVQISKDELQHLLVEASKEGALQALRMVGPRNEKKWVDANEALTLLGKSRSTLERYVESGLIATNEKSYHQRRFLTKDILKMIGR